MKQFDYKAAWKEVVNPLWWKQPKELKKLLDLEEVQNSGQAKNLNCPIPEKVEEILVTFSSEKLSIFARVCYFRGHWSPCGTSKHGKGWKLSNMIDQVLRIRLDKPAVDNSHFTGIGYSVHKGAIRVQFSTAGSWTWVEMGPAVKSTLDKIQALKGFPMVPSSMYGDAREKFENKAYKFTEAYKSGLPTNAKSWKAFLDNDKYMREPEKQSKPKNYYKKKAIKLKKEYRAEMAKIKKDKQTEFDGHLWLLNHGIGIDNCIYYNHTDVFCFGWYDQISKEVKNELLDVLCEFPYAYEIKSEDGKHVSTRAA